MYSEFFSILVILLVVSVGLLVLNAVVAGLLALLCKLAFWRCFRWGLLALAVPPLLLVYGILVERNLYRVNEVEIVSETLPAAFDGYTLVQLSDIHARSFRLRPKSMERAVARVNAQQADLIVFTGDLVTIGPDELEPVRGALAGLHAPDGVLSVLGNHDYCPYLRVSDAPRLNREAMELVEKGERAMGWHLLLNENVKIARGSDTLAVLGVENVSTSRAFPSTGDLARAMEGTQDCWRILLSHDPTHWEKEVVGKEDIPLTLSGHTHAAQVSFFGLWTPSSLLYPHNRGLYKEQGQYLYVNIGLGETIFPARIGAVPEITRITLRRPA
ncbi:MAG: metallophosphoesterase [Bacteroidales bacterium]|nr:metallophosphoesterase [Bacteroidales bacterium]